MRIFKVITTILITGILCIVFTTFGVAGFKGNPRKGRYLYRKNCLTCHAKGEGKNVEVKVLEPNSMTQEQWKTIFQHDGYKKLKCTNKWAHLPEKDLNDIYLFLFEHASDSTTPLSCTGDTK